MFCFIFTVFVPFVSAQNFRHRPLERRGGPGGGRAGAVAGGSGAGPADVDAAQRADGECHHGGAAKGAAGDA